MEMTIVGWVAVFLGLIGAVLNASKLKIGFVVWFVANILQIILAYNNQMYFNIVQFGFYTFICIFGYVKWGKNKTICHHCEGKKKIYSTVEGKLVKCPDCV